MSASTTPREIAPAELKVGQLVRRTYYYPPETRPSIAGGAMVTYAKEQRVVIRVAGMNEEAREVVDPAGKSWPVGKTNCHKLEVLEEAPPERLTLPVGELRVGDKVEVAGLLATVHHGPTCTTLLFAKGCSVGFEYLYDPKQATSTVFSITFPRDHMVEVLRG